jgi:hypothetical protein
MGLFCIFSFLHCVQPLVQPVQGDQLLVRAHLADGFVFQHHDLVGVADGGEAVGDDDDRATLHQPLQRLLDELLRLRVHRRGGFI